MKRGDVVLIRLPQVDPASPTHVQRGLRPAVIVQSRLGTLSPADLQALERCIKMLLGLR